MTIEKNNQLVDTLLFASRDAIAICSEGQHVIQINSEFSKHFGYQESEVLGNKLQDLLMADSDSWQDLQDAISSGQDWEGNIAVRCKDDTDSSMPVCFKQVTEDTAEHSKSIAIFSKCLTNGENPESQYDALTKLPKYYLFVDRIEQALIAAPRSNKSVALLMIGLDKFVRINDGLGYKVGDQVLVAIADRLAKTVRRSDTAARIEADRFGLVMQITTVEDSVIVAEKILKAMNETILLDQQSVSITASIGISIFPNDSQDRDELIKNAESAMRHIKKQGGNQYQFFAREMNQKAKSRIEMEHNLRRALKNEEFVVYYQPKVNLENNAVVGAEALVRWLDPEKGLIPPNLFIPTAEETGLIGSIGEFVLSTACRQNSGWQKQGLTPARISVNVTASQFREKDLFEKVKGILKETQLPPQFLELEITESMLIGDMEQMILKLAAFRGLGIHISIDDFGTGYSSLSYLSRFPITTLKIDRAFIKDMESNAKTAEITNAIIGLSRGLSLEVVAEGAESIEHVQLLRAQGCNLVQGFFFSRPVPAEEFERILEQGYLYDS